MKTLNLENLINQKLMKLPYLQKQSVLDFIDFLSQRSNSAKQKTRLSFEWEGALKGIYKKISSVELQHKIWEI